MNNQSHAGFTLIELTIYGGLLGILLVILSQFFIAILTVQMVSNADTAVEQDGKYILVRTAYDLRRAKAITFPALGQSAATISATINESGVDTTYQYARINSNLILTVGAVSAQLNSDATNVSNFTVTRLGNSGQVPSAKDTAKISFTVQSKAVTSSGPIQTQYQTTVSLR